MHNSRSRSAKRKATNDSERFPRASRGGRSPIGGSFDETGFFDFERSRSIDKVRSKQHNVFSWLRWAPPVTSPCYKALHGFFPGALPAQAVLARINHVIQGQYRMGQDNTLFGTSSCPDEINLQKGGLVDLMEKDWGQHFPLGGISGVPFAGKSGFTTFFKHVPDDGNIIVLFGPHVGISASGEIGKVLRQGQSELSTACGSVIGAYRACMDCLEKSDESQFDPTDMQMDWMKKKVVRFAEGITKHDNPMACLAHYMYNVVRDEVLKVVNTKFGSGRLVLIGGIMINMPEEHSMHFLPQIFEVRREGEQTRDHIEEFNCKITDNCMTRAGVAENDRIMFWTKVLAQIDVFCESTMLQRRETAFSMTQMSYCKNEYVFRQGDIGNTFFVVVSGTVAIEIDGKLVETRSGFLDVDGDLSQQVQNLLKMDDIPRVESFGAQALLNDATRCSSVRAVSEHVICSLMAREAFVGLKDVQNEIRSDHVGDNGMRNRMERGVSFSYVEDVAMDVATDVALNDTCSFSYSKRRRMDVAMGTAHHLFHYLGWSPSFDSKAFRALHENFPGAIPGPVVLKRSLVALTKERFGLTPANTVLGTSICPDEINALTGSLSNIMKDYWGKCCPLGGISGIPFSGKTGFAAFSHHVPDNGNVVMLFGPHVAISAEGEVGKFLRRGQKSSSNACGAVIGAYSSCCDASFTHAEFDEADMQMCFIKEHLKPHVAKIKNFKDPMAVLAHYAYEMVKMKTFEVLNCNFGSGHLVLIGGIQINMAPPLLDHFLPLTFQVTRAGQDGFVDLLSVFECTEE